MTRRPRNRTPRSAAAAAAAKTLPSGPQVASQSLGAERIWLAVVALAIVIGGVVAYHNSFSGVFLLDDFPRIVDNPQVQRLWPLSAVVANVTRPTLQIALAFNYAIGGADAWGYHAFNLTIHILASLALFGIVRRMLYTESMRERYGAKATALAGAVAGIWLVHPLQTQAVTYIIQRAESMMGLCFLVTIYCGARACSSEHRGRWVAAATVACALGMGAKEVMVSVPIVMLLYDRTFISGSFKRALRANWVLHALLASTWIVVAAYLAQSRAEESMQMVDAVNPLHYALTECAVVAHYLRLALWPNPLVFDYAWPPATTLISVLPSVALVLALLAGTLWALATKKWPGFWGAWFFLVLAPTSSIMPIADIAVEHRMYVPLAAVVLLCVLGGHELVRLAAARAGMSAQLQRGLQAGMATVVIAALCVATILRNEDYRSAIVMWTDVMAKRPDNPRAHNNLGVALVKQDRIDEALARYAEAVRLKPDYVDALNNLGATLAKLGRNEEAIVHFAEAVRVWPTFADAHGNLGSTLLRMGRPVDAIAHLQRAVNLKPDSAQTHNALGNALYLQNRNKEAIAEYVAAIRVDPKLAEAHHNLGLAVLEQGETERAIGHFSEAIRLKPDYAKAHNNLGILLHQQGRTKEAIEHFSEAVRLDPKFVEARNNLQALR